MLAGRLLSEPPYGMALPPTPRARPIRGRCYRPCCPLVRACPHLCGACTASFSLHILRAPEPVGLSAGALIGTECFGGRARTAGVGCPSTCTHGCAGTPPRRRPAPSEWPLPALGTPHSHPAQPGGVMPPKEQPRCQNGAPHLLLPEAPHKPPNAQASDPPASALKGRLLFHVCCMP